MPMYPAIYNGINPSFRMLAAGTVNRTIVVPSTELYVIKTIWLNSHFPAFGNLDCLVEIRDANDVTRVTLVTTLFPNGTPQGPKVQLNPNVRVLPTFKIYINLIAVGAPVGLGFAMGIDRYTNFGADAHSEGNVAV